MVVPGLLREKMSFRYSIRLSGAGGHGLIQAARILAEAAAIYDDKNAAESCSYGPEARGNASRVEIVISDEAIDYPKAHALDLLVVLTQEAYDNHIGDLGKDGTVVAEHHVKICEKVQGRKVYSVPFMEIAEKECGKPAMVNIVALGFVSEVSKIIGKQSIQQAILARVPKMSEDIYLKAYEAGFRAAVRLMR